MENKETIEEVASEYANKELNKELTSKVGNFYGFYSSFKEGAKWQAERMLKELQLRLVIIKSEPDGLVRETMINNLLIDLKD
jgi:hypothetical protein